MNDATRIEGTGAIKADSCPETLRSRVEPSPESTYRALCASLRRDYLASRIGAGEYARQLSAARRWFAVRTSDSSVDEFAATMAV